MTVEASVELKVIISAINQTKGVIDGLVRDLSKISKTLSTTTAGAGMREAVGGTKQLGEEAKKASGFFRTLQNSVHGVNEGISTLADALKFVAGGFLAIEGIRFATGLVQTAARADELRTAFHAVALDAGLTAEQSEKLAASIKGLGFGSVATYQSLTRMVQANLDLSKATQLAKVAQDRAAISMRSSDEVFRELVYAIQSGSTRYLRHLGIIIDVNRAEQNYRREIGKTAGQLTLRQRSLAITNEIIKEHAKDLGLAQVASLQLSRVVDHLRTSQEELTTAIGRDWLPGVITLVREYALFIDKLNAHKEAQEADRIGIGKATEALNSFAKALRPVFEFIAEHFETIVTFTTVLTGLLILATVGKVVGIAGRAVAEFVVSAASLAVELAAIASRGPAAATAIAGVGAAASTASAISGASAATATLTTETIAASEVVPVLTRANVFAAAGWIALAVAIGIAIKKLGDWIYEVEGANKKTVTLTETIPQLEERLKRIPRSFGGTVAVEETLDTLKKLKEAYVEFWTTQERNRLKDLISQKAALQEQLTDAQNRMATGGPGVAAAATKEAADIEKKIRDITDKIEEQKVVLGSAAAQETKFADINAKRVLEAALANAKDEESRKRLLVAIQDIDKDIAAADAKAADAGTAAKRKADKEKLESELDYDKALKQLFGEAADSAKASQQAVAGIASKAGAQAIADFNTIFNRVMAGVTSGEITIKDASNRIQQALLATFGRQKTQADLTSFQVLLQRISRSFPVLAAEAKKLLLEAQFKKGTEAIKELQAHLNFYIDATKHLVELQKDYNDIVSKGAEANIAYQQILAGLTNNRAAQAALEVKLIASEVEAIRSNGEAQIKTAELVAAQERASARARFTDAAQLAEKLTAIEKDLSEKRIKSEKETIVGLIGEQKKYLDNFKKYKEEQKKLILDLRDSQEQYAKDIREIYLASGTDEERQYNKEADIIEAIQRARSAAAEGDTDRVRKQIDLARSLSKEIATSSIGDVEENRRKAIGFLTQIQSLDEEVNASQQHLAANAAAINKTAAENLGASIIEGSEKLKESVQTLVKEFSKISVTLDDKSFSEMVTAIRDKFSALTFPIKVVAETGLIGLSPSFGAGAAAIAGTTLPSEEKPPLHYAQGGKIDSVLAHMTPGEFVMRTAAVNYYGERFMNLINRMQLPRFQGGGLVDQLGVASPETGKPGDHVTINLRSGDKKAKVFGTRDDVRDLVSVLRQVSVGT